MITWKHLLFGCATLGCALSSAAEVTASVDTPRGLQTLKANGDAPPSADTVSVRVHLGEAEALRFEVEVSEQRWTLEQRCSPRLAPASYRVTVHGPDDAEWAAGELRVGTPEDEARARLQQREFFRGVVVTELTLEHGGLEDRAWLTVDAGQANEASMQVLADSIHMATRSTQTALRMFDLRAAQPYLPKVRKALDELLALSRARADAWLAFGKKPAGTPPPQDPRVKELVTEVAKALGLPVDALLERFGRTPLGHLEPPVSKGGGTWTSVLGFSVELPNGVEAAQAIERSYSTDLRLMVGIPPTEDSPGGQLLLRLAPLPFSVKTYKDFVQFVEIENWEREGIFSGYRRLVAAEDEEHGKLRLRFTGHLRDVRTAEGAAVEGQQIALYDPKGRRALIGYLFGAGVDGEILETLKWEEAK